MIVKLMMLDRSTMIKKAREKARKANQIKESGNLTEIEIK